MSAQRRHHLVPQLHLRRFANGEEKIVAVARDLSKSIVTDVANVAVEKDFYAVETSSGSSMEVEELLSKVESDAEAVIRRILDQGFQLEQREKESLAMFCAFQWLRGRDQRDSVESLMNHVHKLFTMNLTRRQIREGLTQTQGRQPTDDEVESMVEYLSNPNNYEYEFSANHSIQSMLENVNDLASIVMARTWQVVRFPTECLLTSDAPVSLWSPPSERQGLFSAVGFGTAKEIRVPLDRRHALVLAWDATQGEILRDLSDAHAHALNYSTASNGYRWIFHHPDDRPLKSLGALPATRKFAIDGPFSRIVPDGL
jgi:hypothetical protein